jgi:hypothetical protein
MTRPILVDEIVAYDPKEPPRFRVVEIAHRKNEVKIVEVHPDGSESRYPVWVSADNVRRLK